MNYKEIEEACKAKGREILDFQQSVQGKSDWTAAESHRAQALAEEAKKLTTGTVLSALVMCR
jgi:hypothetical protein